MMWRVRERNKCEVEGNFERKKTVVSEVSAIVGNPVE